MLADGPKKKDKPGKPFDKFTGQHMREWWNRLNQGIGDSDASAQLLALAAEGLAIASHSLKAESHEFASGIVRSPEVRRRLDAQTRPEIIKATRCVDLVFPEPIIEGESAPVRKQRDDTLKELFWALRNQVYELRALNKEYVGRTRSLRFFRAIEQAQRVCCFTTVFILDQASNVDSMPIEPSLCCGHVGEPKMRAAAAERNVQQLDATQMCALILLWNALLNETNKCQGGHSSWCQACRNHRSRGGFPKDERVLIFVQFEDLLTNPYASTGRFPSVTKGTAHQNLGHNVKISKTKLGKNDERMASRTPQRVCIWCEPNCCKSCDLCAPASRKMHSL